MRKTLTAAAALAPLWLAAGAALAQTTTITSGSATPVQTATAASGAPSDVTIQSGGTITVSSPGVAGVTVNSPNNFTNTGGLIQSSNINNAIGVLITTPGASGTEIDQDGTISLKDSNGASTDSTTGATQAPFAPLVNGNELQFDYGIWLNPTAGGVYAGTILNDSSGAITVTADNSYGILIGSATYSAASAGAIVTSGSVSNLGSITVTGNANAGIYTTAGIGGSFTSQGAVTATGQYSAAIVLGGDVSGRVSVYAATTASGYGSDSRSASNVIQQDIQNTLTNTTGSEVQQGGSALVIGGNVGQGIYLGAPPANTASGSTLDLDGDSLEDGGEGTASVTTYGYQPGMVIGAAGRNLVIGPLQLISSATTGTIPTTSSTGTTGNGALLGQSLVVSGSVSGQGIEDGVPATGLQIGAVIANPTGAAAGANANGPAAGIGAMAPVVSNGQGGFNLLQGAALSNGATFETSGTVTLQGGLYINSGGSVSATAYGADAIAMHILGGSSVPTITVAGALSATVDQPLANSSTGNPTPYNGSSYGLVIESGANVNTLNVSGSLTAVTNGDGSVNSKINNAAAVTDYSGTLSNVSVTGEIIASLTPTETTITPGGSVTALNLGYNTTGVALQMNQAPQTETVAVTASGATTTTTYTTTNVVANTTGAVVTATSSPNSTTTITTSTPTAPTITGDVYVGSGANSLDIEAGTLTGNLYVGTEVATPGGTMAITMGQSGLVASGTFLGTTLGATPTFTGALVSPLNSSTNLSATVFSFNINSGTFTNTFPEALAASSLRIGSSGVMSFALDPGLSVKNGGSAYASSATDHTSITVTGTATLAAGAGIGVNVLSNIVGVQTFTLITATGGLNIAGSTATFATDIPYLFFGTTQQVGNSLDITIREKTPSELGMNAAEGASLPAIYAALPLNSSIQSAIFGQYDKGAFFKLYDQLLPADYQGGLFRAASEAERTISRLTADPNQIENPTGSRGAWAQQFFIGAYQGRGETLPFNAGGFGYAGGVETGGLGFGAVGLTGAFVAINEEDPQSPTDQRTSMSELEVGAYWQGEISGLTLDARVGAGYDWFGGRRQFIQLNSVGDITYSTQTKSNWNGYSLVGHVGAAYQIDLGSVFFLRPQVQGDYFRLSQDAYTEGGGATGFNLALASRVGDETSAEALMTFGAKFGRYVVWRPELSLGVRDAFDGNAGSITSRFTVPSNVSFTATPFTVDPASITGPAGVARLKFKGSSEYYEVGIEAGTEIRSRYEEGDAKLSVRVLF